jgi:hypothetical protein
MATVKISIPVKTMGYTGQRDQWEKHTKDFAVYYDGSTIRLQPSGYGYGTKGFEFTEAELKQALDFIRDQNLTTELPDNGFVRD